MDVNTFYDLNTHFFFISVIPPHNLRTENSDLIPILKNWTMLRCNKLRGEVEGGHMFEVEGGHMFEVEGGHMFEVEGGCMFEVEGGCMFEVEGGNMFEVEGGHV